MFRYQSGNSQELLVLDADGYNVIRECMETVADTYNGKLALHSHILDSKVKEVQNQMHELCLKHERQIVDLELSNERAGGKIAMLEQQLEASQLQLDQQAEMSRLRLETQELKFNAQLLEKDRRTAELLALEE
ncbi:hypothetical protein AC1031_007881 [Aphanomyces cochlioides]|nr:hypothetical protein AC1031_007881 [Aphanomyces cochlioides]